MTRKMLDGRRPSVVRSQIALAGFNVTSICFKSLG
jgi:hypothetical protein